MLLWEVMKGFLGGNPWGSCFRGEQLSLSENWDLAPGTEPGSACFTFCTIFVGLREVVQKIGGGGQWDFPLC